MNQSIYESATTYFEGPENMENELLMWYTGAALITKHALSKELPLGALKDDLGLNVHPVKADHSVLDLCTGPGNFLNYISMLNPTIQGVGVDINEAFIEYCRNTFPEQWQFHCKDALQLDLNESFDIVTASSAYHHIPDHKKPRFLNVIAHHLRDDGIAILCENFLPAYNDDRSLAVNQYYDALEAYYEAGHANPNGLETIKEVREAEHNGFEHKVDYQRFTEHLEEVQLEVAHDITVWQPEQLRPGNAGSHVICLTTS